MKLSGLYAASAVATVMALAPSAHAQEWDGFYAGASLTYADADNEFSFFSGKPGAPSLGTTGVDGVLGGVYAGHNWQRNNLVFGFEANLKYGSVEGESRILGKNFKTEVDWTADARLRGGYAFNTLLVYGFGGLTASSADLDIQFFPDIEPIDLVGWNAGVGVEYALSDAWSVRSEWSRLDFGKNNGVSNINTEVQADTFSVGVTRSF